MKRLTALLLSALLLLTACGAPTAGPQTGSSSPTLKKLALKEPTYPAFPQYPQYDQANRNKFYDDQQDYYDALIKFRGDGISDSTADLLRNFAAASTSLAMAGHEGENAIYSPLSLWSALALLAQCAEGESRQQVLDALGADSVDQLRALVPELWQGLYTRDGKNALIPANSIWLNDSMKGSYVQETLDALAEDYYAGSYAVPMGSGEADKAVSEWVSEQTGGLIGGDSPVVQTDPETLALLVSSLYYKAAWRNEFNDGATKPRTFTAADGSEVQADFMHQSDHDSFLMREGYQAAALSTHLGQMLFVLPDEGVSPESLLADPEFLPNLSLDSEDAIRGLVKWYVPKFDAESTLDLMGTLKAMGVTDLLNPTTADMSALTTLEAYVGGATQMARVKVDEQGVEAAAVTIVEAPASAPWESEKPKECIMNLDRPFLFVIQSKNVPLFIGVINEVK